MNRAKSALNIKNRRRLHFGVVPTLLASVLLASCGGSGGGHRPNGTGPTVIGTGGGPVGPAFFSMHVNNISSPLPTNPSINVPIAGVRLWDTQTAWAQVETGNGTYNWTLLSDRVQQARTANLDVLYDFARTPQWAACTGGSCMCGGSNTACANSTSVPPSACTYAADESTPADCYPPSDLNADGTGTDQIWINWVTSVVTQFKGQIAYYEVWNEPNIAASWQGSWQQLARMAADARCIIKGDAGCNSMSSYAGGKGIDTSAQLITPAFTTSSDSGSAPTPADGLAAYLPVTVNGISGNAASFANVVAFHGYPAQSSPEQVVQVLQNTQSKLTAMNLSVPVFDTEGSWGAHAGISNLTDPDQQAGFTARYLMIQQALGVARMYWYAWDLPDDDGTLWCPSGGNCTAVNSTGLTKAGVAYQQTEAWTSGTTSGSCSYTGSIWTCSYTRSGGYQALAVWDSSQSCNSGTCTTSTFTVPSSPSYTQYQDLSGNINPVSGGVVQIGAKPILLETGNIP